MRPSPFPNLSVSSFTMGTVTLLACLSGRVGGSNDVMYMTYFVANKCKVLIFPTEDVLMFMQQRGYANSSGTKEWYLKIHVLKGEERTGYGEKIRTKTFGTRFQ